MLAACIHGDLVHRARPVERIERDQVLEFGRAHLLERLAHALGLELEHARRVAAREHLVRAAVVERQRRHIRPLSGRALDDVERVLDHIEVAQAEEVHLEQADLLDRLHRELRDHAERALAVLIGARVGHLQRDDLGQGSVRDDDRGGVDRGVAHDPLETLRDVDDAPRVRVLVACLAQRLAVLQAVLERRRAPHDRVGYQLGEAVAGRVVVTEHSRGVARRRAREHLPERDDLRNRLAPVLLGHVSHHALDRKSVV